MNYLIKNIINCFFNNRNRVTIVSVYKVIGFIALIFWQLSAYSQPSFETSTHRDTLCFDDNAEFVNTNIIPTNKYYWDFCAPDLSKNPSSGNITVPVGKLNGPAFISTIEAPEGVYAFVTNYTDGTLTRLFFSDINLPPTVINLGTLNNQMPLQPEGISIVQDDDGKYYGFVVGGQDPDYKLARLDFNNSLLNIPSVVYLTGTGDGLDNYLNKPMGICLKKDSKYWLAFITNYDSNSITKLSFANIGGLKSSPFLDQITNADGVKLNGPIGIQIINDGSHWYGFVSNNKGYKTPTDYFITRITFVDFLESTFSSDTIKNNSLD